MEDQQVKYLFEGRKELSFALVSDIHMRHDNVERLTKWQQKHNRHFDLLLLLGDFDNLKLDRQNPDLELCAKSEEQITILLNNVVNALKPQYSFLLPGNHDSYNLFENQIDIGNIKNIHKRHVQLVEGLALLGFGGSVQGTYLNTVPPQKVPGWEGYLYDTDEDYELEFQEFLQSVPTLLEKSQYILATHLGPTNSHTSIYNSDKNGQIQGGSEAIWKLLSSHQLDILANVHGHVHDAQGVFSYGRWCKIINDGPLQNGQFTTFTIQLDEKLNKWIFSSIEFFQLNQNVI